MFRYVYFLRMSQEKYSQTNKKLNHGFVDLEKAFDQYWVHYFLS